MEEIRDRVIKHIVVQLHAMLSISEERRARKVAEAIINNPNLAIVERDAELPGNHWENEDMQRGWDIAQKVMVKGGWVKEV